MNTLELKYPPFFIKPIFFSILFLELHGCFKNGISDRSQVAVDAFEIPDYIEMQAAGYNAIGNSSPYSLQMSGH